MNDAYDALDSIDDGSPKKMGTTLAFLKFHSNGIIIAHIGDSRVYHIRPGKDTNDTNILFQTRDHSLVNDLIKIGELTPEEAKYSRQKNVITRAMQPNMDHHPKADLYHTQDIQPGDYFMLCSDGILEQMEDNHLQFIFSDKGGSAKNKVDMLRKVTANNRDNHSAILVHVLGIHTMNEKDEVEEKEYMLSSSTFEDNVEKENKEVIFSTARINTNHYPLRWGIMFLIIIFLVVCGYICLRIFEPTLG